MIAQIMILGKNEFSIKEIFNAIHLQKRWSVTIVMDVETALEKMHMDNFDIVLIEHTIEAIEENKLRKISHILHPDTVVLKVEDLQLLEPRLISILNNKNKAKQKSFLITDDALKNAVINISLN